MYEEYNTEKVQCKKRENILIAYEDYLYYILVRVNVRAGTGHIAWRYHVMLTKSFQEFENITQTVQSTATERKAWEGILQDIAGDLNERSPQVVCNWKMIWSGHECYFF